MSDGSLSSQSKRDVPTAAVVVDGSGSRYTVVGSFTTFLLQGEDGKLIEASEHTVRGLQLEVSR